MTKHDMKYIYEITWRYGIFAFINLSMKISPLYCRVIFRSMALSSVCLILTYLFSFLINDKTGTQTYVIVPWKCMLFLS